MRAMKAEISRRIDKNKKKISKAWKMNSEECREGDVIFCVGTHTGLLQRLRTIHQIYFQGF